MNFFWIHENVFFWVTLTAAGTSLCDLVTTAPRAGPRAELNASSELSAEATKRASSFFSFFFAILFLLNKVFVSLLGSNGVD